MRISSVRGASSKGVSPPGRGGHLSGVADGEKGMDLVFLNMVTSNLLVSALLVYPLWRIHSRAGLHPALALLVFLPGIGLLAVLMVLALARWPAIEGGR